MATTKQLVVVDGCVQVDKAYQVGEVLPKLNKAMVDQLISLGYAQWQIPETAQDQQSQNDDNSATNDVDQSDENQEQLDQAGLDLDTTVEATESNE
ncbi:hypothetical protein VQ643_09500 [Pseudomonas sp. F1_0610]|uniref:hypothetical protein n=1 Tax=Pseudomonas sp. F1_0610 TaxID=3114284 RepID=UPI0039C1B9D2